MNMQKDLFNLLEVSHNRGFENITIEFTSDRYRCVNCNFDNIFIDKTGISILDTNGALFIPFNNLLSVEVT